MALNRRDFIKAAATAPVFMKMGMASAADKDMPAQRDGTLTDRIGLLKDAHRIENLMSNYQYLYTAGLHDETAKMFAQKTPGLKLEIADFGVYEGIDGIRRFIGATKYIEGDRKGVLNIHTLTTQVLEVAVDGQTAQGVWWSPGVETGPSGDGMKAMWVWNKYGVDFVKEGGDWKFWHFHLYHLFRADHDRSWTEPHPCPLLSLPEEFMPDRPNTYHWIYSPTVPFAYIPEPPLPYSTWDERRAYVKATV